FERDAHRAVAQFLDCAEARHHDGAFARHRVDVEFAGEAANGAEPGAGCSHGREAVTHAARDVRHASAAIDGQQFDGSGVVIAEFLDQQFSAAGMQQQVVGELGGGDGRAARGGGIQFEVGERVGGATCFADLARVVDHVTPLRVAYLHFYRYFHRVIVTRVPPLTLLSISNSFTRRLAPV